MEEKEQKKKGLFPAVLMGGFGFAAICCVSDQLGTIGASVNSAMVHWFGYSRYIVAVLIGATLYLKGKHNPMWVLIDAVFIVLSVNFSMYYPLFWGAAPQLVSRPFAEPFGAGLLNFATVFTCLIPVYLNREKLMKYADENISPVLKGKISMYRPADGDNQPIQDADGTQLVFRWQHKEKRDKDCSVIQNALDQYGIEAAAEQCIDGLSTTTYVIRPNPGTKVAQVFRAKNELALALERSDRDISMANDNGVITLSVTKAPEDRKSPSINDLLNNESFMSELYSMPIGITQNGQLVKGDFRTFPHLIVAGGTGSGKTSFIQSIVFTVAMKLSPDDLQIILIDGNYQDLQCFANLPHLLIDNVLCDTNEVIEGLRVAVREMDDRMKTRHNNFEAKFPELLIVVDEIDKLIRDSKISALLERIANEGRKFGLHLVLGSQNPSGDRISPHILANMVSRVCLRVEKSTYSENFIGIPDGNKLGGNGDMFFSFRGQIKRLQGFYIDPKFIRSQIPEREDCLPEQEENAQPHSDFDLFVPTPAGRPGALAPTAAAFKYGYGGRPALSVVARKNYMQREEEPEARDDGDNPEIFETGSSLSDEDEKIVRFILEKKVSYLTAQKELGISSIGKIQRAMAKAGYVQPRNGRKKASSL